jgi:16S rRNA (adenine1518-N6/adenine1519-N6)-dimethyltransferase
MDDNVKAKKSLGQHWLHDDFSLEAMCEMAGVSKGELIVEVGPGLGTLTKKLLDRGARVHAVEFDEGLASDLPKRVVSDDLEVANKDILKVNFNDFEPGYKVVANIPYYLTSNLIRSLSETANPPKSATLLIQKEVAERLCAGPGNMSLLSVWAQMYFVCSLGPIVPARLFTPPPKVDSQIVHMECREEPVFGNTDKRLLTRVIKAGFSNKRKTLHNSLAAGMHIHKDQAADLLDSVNIKLTSRPQELSLHQWVDLAHKI